MNKSAADKKFRKGKELCLKGDRNGLSLMTEVIDGYSKDIMFLSHRGFWRLEFKLYEKALEDATKVLKVKPNTVNAHKVMFGANLALGRISECKKAILNIKQTSFGLQRRLKVKELNNKLDQYLIDSDIASSHFAGKKYELLVQQAERNLKVAPKDGKMLYYLVSGLFNQNLYERVIQIQVCIIRNTAKEEEILRLLAKSYFALNRIAEAVEVLYKSDQFNFIKDIETYTRIKMFRDSFWSNLAEKKFQAVCDSVNACRKLCKEIDVQNNVLRFEMHYAGYKFYLGIGYNSHALSSLKEAARFRPNNLKLLEELFHLKVNLKEYREAKLDCQKIINLYKKENKDSLFWGKNLLALDKYIEYGEIINDKTKLTTDKALTLFKLTRNNINSKTLKHAYVQLVLENHPDKQADSGELMKEFSSSFTKIVNDAKALLDNQLNTFQISNAKYNLQDSNTKETGSRFSKKREHFEKYMYNHFYSKEEKKQKV